MYRVSEIIGDGRIEGWNISTQSFPTVTVTKGNGLIDGFYVNTFNDTSYTLSPNGSFHFFAQRRVGTIGIEGPKSDVTSISYVDAGPPSTPTDLSISSPELSSDRYSYSILLAWSGVNDIDLDHYEIYRNISGGDYQLIDTTNLTSYEDLISEDSVYSYRIFAVDQSGNQSTSPLEGTVSTPVSPTLPPDPIEVLMPTSESGINILWHRPPSFDFDFISHWLIRYVRLDTDGSPSGDIYELITEKNLYNERIDNLISGQKYKVSIHTVDTHGRVSLGISKNVLPQPSPAPRDPQGIAFSFSEGQYGVKVSLSWTSGDNEYDPATSYRYKIYPQIGNENEALSIDVPPGLTEEEISLYTFGGAEYSVIPENTLVTFRITALDSYGMESFGNYIRMVTPLFRLPKTLANIQTEFDVDTRELVVTWDNQSDTSYVNIRILDDDLEGNYPDGEEDEIVNSDIGLSERYVYQDAEVGHKYTVIITPYNIEGASGNSSTSVELTLVASSLPDPEPPLQVEITASDKQVLITWEKSTSNFVSGYNLYKKTGEVTLDENDWILIDSMDVNVTRFTDYGLQNDQSYSYYITSTDIYDRESDHLPDGAVNLNFVTITPKQQGAITEPTNVVATFDGTNIILTWDSLLEEFDAFTIYRSINNLHQWESISTVDKDTFTYTDTSFPLIDGTTYYYVVDKTVDDADIVVQTSSSAPENSICLGEISLGVDSFNSPDQSCVRDIKDLVDPLTDYVSDLILSHKHLGTGGYAPDRIDLDSEIVITDWEPTDNGRIWTTTEDIFGGTYLVKVNGRFPKVFFQVDAINQQIIFSESISESSEIEMRVLGIEEVQGALGAFRFDNIHARQIQFGQINLEQLPPISHEGRIREKLFPNRYLLERYNNHSFIVPQDNTDPTKTFGDGTAFYSIIDSDGRIKEIIDFDQYDDGLLVGFQKPDYSAETLLNLKQNAKTFELGLSTDNANYIVFDDDVLFTYTNITNSLECLTITGLSKKGTVGRLTSGTYTNAVKTFAFDNHNKILYGFRPIDDVLHFINPVTGESLNSISISGIESGTGSHEIFYVSHLNTLYLQQSYGAGQRQLYTIDTSTGQATKLGQFSSSFAAHMGAYSADSHKVYSHYPSRFCELNLSTAACDSFVSLIGPALYPATYKSDNQTIYGVNFGSILTYTNFIPSISTVTKSTLGSIPASMDIDALGAPRGDWWQSGPDAIRLGDFIGATTEVYLRFPIDAPTSSVISSAELSFTGYGGDNTHETSNGDFVKLQISAIKPDQYGEDVDASDSVISVLPTIGNVVWTPGMWEKEESSSRTSVNISSIIQSFIDDDSYFEGKHVILKIHTLSTTSSGHNRSAYSYGDSEKSPKLHVNYVLSSSEVNSDPGGFQSEKSYHFQFEFEDTDPTRWVQLTTNNSPVKPNPVIDLTKRLRFRAKLNTGSLRLAFGIREISSTTLSTGEDGGTSGSIEWVGIDEILINDDGDVSPVGSTIISSGDDWQEIDIDLQLAKTLSYDGGNGVLSLGLGTLEHLAVSIYPDDLPTEPIDLYIDKLEQVDDLIVAGTSQGILTSGDFGVEWQMSRLTSTPVHKFYRANNNSFLWAITADETLFAVDPQFWFAVGGTTGVQFIKDIAEDIEGNMYISTDKGVYFFEIALVYNFANFRQTQPVTAFTTDCYGLYHNALSSGQDEIWVSTEIGVYKTSDYGRTWQDSGMSTGGLVAYQFLNISSDLMSPNILAITRKHLLRKLPGESDFSIIANFEEQHGIFDLWKMEYFGGKVYISTGSGVFSHSSEDLFSYAMTDVSFEKVLPGLDIDGNVVTSFGLDKVKVSDETYQMFIGQENRLMMLTEEGRLTTKKEFRNKEIPSFFVDNAEFSIGYVYNAFNGVMCFRDPLPVTSVVYSSYLPRKAYTAQLGGWAQTNPEAEVFVYRNGFPSWIYFLLSESEVLSEVQLLQSRINGLPELTTFNSLFPDSEEFKSSTLSSIEVLQSGGDESTPLVNAQTVVSFIDNYTRFLSLISDDLKIEYHLRNPEIISSGIRRADRNLGSRAAILEEVEEFESEESFGIDIDTYSGEIDFLQAFTNTTDPAERDKLSFGKYDNLEITVFNSNVSNIGNMPHRNLEDELEKYNSGSTSNFGRTVNTNLIKAGIFLESRHQYLFDRYNISNVQSKFYASHTNSWYDVVNSTLDYETLYKVPNYPEPMYTTDSHFFNSDPYFANKLWIASDNDILQYYFDSNGELVLDDVVRPGGSSRPMKVTSIYVYGSNEVYVVASEKDSGRSHLYLTYNYGVTWEDLETINLPNEFEVFGIINGTKIMGTSDGPFYCDNDFNTWYPCDVVRSLTVGEDAETAFRKRVRNFEWGTVTILESERYFYTSGSGVEFYAIGRITENDSSVVNAIKRFKNLTWAGTDRGIYNDGNSILSDIVQFGLDPTLEDSAIDSSNVEVNDIVSGNDVMYCCSSNGKIYRYWDDPDTQSEGNIWKGYSVPDFGPIHRMHLYESSDKHYLVVISYNRLKSLDVTPGEGVFE